MPQSKDSFTYLNSNYRSLSKIVRNIRLHNSRRREKSIQKKKKRKKRKHQCQKQKLGQRRKTNVLGTSSSISITNTYLALIGMLAIITGIQFEMLS
ncbi:hypothetical protein TMatcc_007094 [Talaromyces marneffei ATCC 18224]